MENEYMTIEEVANLLKINPRQVRKMIETGRLRAKNINASGGIRKIYRVLKEDVIRPDTI